jgi:hypothetical protein
VTRASFWRPFAFGLVVAFVVQGAQLAQGNGLAFTLRVGVESEAVSIIRRDLGSIPLTQDVGHDGQYNYLIARDPWGLGEHVAASDDPAYRLRRPLVGWLSGLFGVMPPRGALIGLSLVVALGFALAAGMSGVLIDRFGLPAWAHAAVIGCLGLWLSLQLITPDTLMVGLILSGMVTSLTRRPHLAALPLAGAVLSKEVAMLSVAGLAAWLWFENKRRAAVVVGLLPTTVLVAWLVWVHFVFGSSLTAKGNLGLPFVGIAEAVGYWSGGALAFGLLGLVSVVLGVVGAWWSRSGLLWSQIAPWTATAVLSSFVVWGEANNAPRVFALSWVLGILGIGYAGVRRRDPLVSPTQEVAS